MQARFGGIVDQVRRLHASLEDVEWKPFERRASMVVSDAGQRITIGLDVIHFFSTRQTMTGWKQLHKECAVWREPFGENCIVEYFDILSQSPLLSAVASGELEFPGTVVLFDSNGNGAGSSEFIQPVHVAMCSDAGHLDVICEMVELDRE